MSFVKPIKQGQRNPKIRWIARATALLAIAAAVSAAYGQQTVKPSKTASLILGVLEQHVPNTPAATPTPMVRVLFKKKGTQWIAFLTATRTYRDLKSLPLHYSPRVTWTITFDGRDLGKISTQRPKAFHAYDDIGLESIISHGPIPSVGKPSMAFATWVGVPVLRPLVAISQPDYKDPDHWKSDRPSSNLLARARALFHNEFPTAYNCRNIYSKGKPQHYRNSDIRFLKAYSSNKGWVLVELSLIGYRCDGPPDEHGPYISQWYVLNPSGGLRHLGTGMWLVNAGDYDNSGASSLLFAISGINMDGYRLYYRNFSKSVQFTFNYH